MCPQLKTFVCHETQEVLCLHDYQARAAPVRYKAKRNGLPAVIQITPVNDINHNTDLSPMMLCSGVAEKYATSEFNKLTMLYCIEKFISINWPISFT